MGNFEWKAGRTVLDYMTSLGKLTSHCPALVWYMQSQSIVLAALKFLVGNQDQSHRDRARLDHDDGKAAPKTLSSVLDHLSSSEVRRFASSPDPSLEYIYIYRSIDSAVREAAIVCGPGKLDGRARGRANFSNIRRTHKQTLQCRIGRRRGGLDCWPVSGCQRVPVALGRHCIPTITMAVGPL